jgi:tetratricopeptide (TPR) repeat protein
MVFSKSKHLESAQKYLGQGKIPQAIGEYQAILRVDPTDQVTLMTVGDLFVRANDLAQASEYFERLAQVFLEEGFTSKAIAIYKKIAKLAPDHIEPLEKLADLYVQQGVMSEARPLYIQIAEAHLRGRQPERAAEVLRRLLDIEPENIRVQTRLADLYQAIGQKGEAARAYLMAAFRSFERGELDPALSLVDKGLELDQGNTRGITVKARILGAKGRPADAAKIIEALPDAQEGGPNTTLLFEFYMQAGRPQQAVELAGKVLKSAPDKYDSVLPVVDVLAETNHDMLLSLARELRPPMLAAKDFERLGAVLTTVSERIPKDLEVREWLVELYRQSGDTFHLTEAMDQLGDAAVSAGDLERARKVFEELVEREPQNEFNRRRLGQVRQKLGMEPLDAEPMAVRPVQSEVVSQQPSATEHDVMLSPTPRGPAAPAPSAEVAEDDETQRYVQQALTDVDLFSSYNLTEKAMNLLETVLQRVPGHPQALEKQLDFCLGAGNERRTSELAAQLETIYRQKGDTQRADRFADLRRRYSRAADKTAEAATPGEAKTAPPEFQIPVVQVDLPAPAETGEQAAEAVIHEVDLSEDWAALAEQVSPPAEEPAKTGEAAAPAAEAAAPAEESPVPEPVAAPEAAAELEPAPAMETAPEPAPVEEAAPAAPQEEAFEITLEPESAPAPPAEAEPVMELELEPATAEPKAEAPAAEKAEEFELEFSPEPSTPAAQTEKTAGTGKKADGALADLAMELEGIDFGPDQFSGTEASARASAPPPELETPVSSQDMLAASGKSHNELKEVFDEFRAELGELEEDEDPETHYNLGIAYREMDLVEEAISEFQKVAKLVQHVKTFRYTMQCYTLLGLCFMGRGEGKIAAMWYKKALDTPGLDQESVLALTYDLGVAQETGGNREAALDSFKQVYGMNIDYRDVASRIADLQKRR